MGTFFALQPMDTLTFDVDMNAAVIEESPMPQGYQICRSDDIPSYQVFLPTAFLENCTFCSTIRVSLQMNSVIHGIRDRLINVCKLTAISPCLTVTFKGKSC